MVRRGVERCGRDRHFREALRAEQRLIVLTAHLGDWELGGRQAARINGRAMHIGMEAELRYRLDRLLQADSPSARFIRRRHLADVLEPVAPLHGEIVAIEGDRAIGGRGDVAAPFFGALAHRYCCGTLSAA